MPHCHRSFPIALLHPTDASWNQPQIKTCWDPCPRVSFSRTLTKQRTRWPAVTVENLEGASGDKCKGAVDVGFEHLSTHSCHPQFRPQPSCSWFFAEQWPARFSKMLHKWHRYPAKQRHKQRPLRADLTFRDQTPPSLLSTLQPPNSRPSALQCLLSPFACWTLFQPGSAHPLVHLCLGDTPTGPTVPPGPLTPPTHTGSPSAL